MLPLSCAVTGCEVALPNMESSLTTPATLIFRKHCCQKLVALAIPYLGYTKIYTIDAPLDSLGLSIIVNTAFDLVSNLTCLVPKK